MHVAHANTVGINARVRRVVKPSAHPRSLKMTASIGVGLAAPLISSNWILPTTDCTPKQTLGVHCYGTIALGCRRQDSRLRTSDAS